MILCCGEALIDMLPAKSSLGEDAFLPRPGGCSYNAALALARLKIPAAFLANLSTSFLGDLLVSRLDREGVNTSLVRRVDSPTTLAFVKIEADREPQYAFFFNGTADRSLRPADLPATLSDEISCLVFGSISLTMEPGATALETLVFREAKNRPISFDPNLRPAAIQDRKAFVARFAGWLRASTIVKLSAADLELLDPSPNQDVALERLCETALEGREGRPLLIVLTLGAEGSLALLYAGDKVVRSQVPGHSVPVADTVGAGDCFHAGLLAWLHENGKLSFEGLDSLDASSLTSALKFANACGALACTRSGAEPPSQKELGAFLDQPSNLYGGWT